MPVSENLVAWLWQIPRRLGWGEFMALLAFALCAGGLYVFIEIVEQVLEGETHRVDRALLLALRHPANPADPIGPEWLEIMFSDLTVLGGYTFVFTAGLLASGYFILIRKWVSLAFVLVSVAGGALISSTLKNLFERPRPDLVPHLVEVQTASLPSGHAMLSAVAYLTLGALLAASQSKRRIKVYVVSSAIILALLVGFSRIYLGVHWPTDVLAGWSIGAAWAMACWLAARGIEGWRAAGGQEPSSS